MFNLVLDSISQLVGDNLESIRVADWNILAQLSPSRSAADVQRIFFPHAPVEVLADPKINDSLHRRPKFLAAVDDTAYQQIYQKVLGSTNLCFPDFQGILRVGRHQGKVMSQVMNHVVHWLNANPTKVSDRDPNKPQLWQNFLLAFDGESGQARRLQRQIFEFVGSRVDEFTSDSNNSYLATLPHAQDDSYLKRFVSPVWQDLLISVHKTVGLRFQEPLSKFNTSDLEGLPSQPESTLTQAFSDAITRIPDVSRNPALSSQQALEVLMAKISPIVTAWAAEQCKETQTAASPNRMSPRALAVEEIVRAQHDIDVEIPESNMEEDDDDERGIEDALNYLRRSTERPNSDMSNDEVTQASATKNLKGMPQPTHLLLDEREMRMQRIQHRQNHSGRSTGDQHANRKDVPEVLQVEEPRTKTGILNTLHIPAKKTVASRRKSDWRNSPAAHAGSARPHRA